MLYSTVISLHLHLSRSHGDRWGATGLETLSLHLILLGSLRVLQNFKPVDADCSLVIF